MMMGNRGFGSRFIALALAHLAQSPELERDLRIRNLAVRMGEPKVPPKIHERRGKGHDVIPDRLMRKSRRPR